MLAVIVSLVGSFTGRSSNHDSALINTNKRIALVAPSSIASKNTNDGKIKQLSKRDYSIPISHTKENNVCGKSKLAVNYASGKGDITSDGPTSRPYLPARKLTQW
ncbi:hypothetical protein GJ496_011155 [Pomphorhynchus laevis]|nr:hypothetical protein GJ496_011155 [Pomphorhynchus laevis]